jgi:hypothetical protein
MWLGTHWVNFKTKHFLKKSNKYETSDLFGGANQLSTKTIVLSRQTKFLVQLFDIWNQTNSTR